MLVVEVNSANGKLTWTVVHVHPHFIAHPQRGWAIKLDSTAMRFFLVSQTWMLELTN